MPYASPKFSDARSKERKEFYNSHEWRGIRKIKLKRVEQLKAIEFFMTLASCDMDYCIENPVSIMSTQWRKSDQIIQPWQFGHGETKKTCLWLQGLPPLDPTKVVKGRQPRVHHEPLQKTDGRTEVDPIRVSLMRWQASGADTLFDQAFEKIRADVKLLLKQSRS
jgi:hypothetical protein